MNNAELKKLNKITYILNLVMENFELGFFKPHVELFVADSENHPLMLDVYEKIEKTVKET